MGETLDILAIAAHPDDVELAAGGTLALCVRQGLQVGVLDLTRGELGTRGTPELRTKETAAATAVLGLSVRENLGLPDGNITASGLGGVVEVLRKWRPRIVMTHPAVCRHPDHQATHTLVRDACYYAGLKKMNTGTGASVAPWRPKHLLYFAEVKHFEPTFIVDVTTTWEQRMQALKCYGSQVHNPDYKEASEEPETFISNAGFSEWIEARARTYGHLIGCAYGEPFQYSGTLGTANIDMFLNMEAPFQ